jgi:transposase
VSRTSPLTVRLSPQDRAVLEARARKYSLPYRDVLRAKIVLLAAQDVPVEEIAYRLDTPREVVWKWRRRFLEEGLAGLDERPRRGRPTSFSPSGDR